MEELVAIVTIVRKGSVMDDREARGMEGSCTMSTRDGGGVVDGVGTNNTNGFLKGGV